MTRYIDADVVIKHIEEYWEMVKLGKPSRGMTAVIQNIKTIINSLPTVDAEPVRHGKWKVTPVYIKCSECGESFMLIPQNYCPNCGADMRGEE